MLRASYKLVRVLRKCRQWFRFLAHSVWNGEVK